MDLEQIKSILHNLYDWKEAYIKGNRISIRNKNTLCMDISIIPGLDLIGEFKICPHYFIVKSVFFETPSGLFDYETIRTDELDELLEFIVDFCIARLYLKEKIYG